MILIIIGILIGVLTYRGYQKGVDSNPIEAVTLAIIGYLVGVTIFGMGLVLPAEFKTPEWEESKELLIQNGVFVLQEGDEYTFTVKNENGVPAVQSVPVRQASVVETTEVPRVEYYTAQGLPNIFSFSLGAEEKTYVFYLPPT